MNLNFNRVHVRPFSLLLFLNKNNEKGLRGKNLNSFKLKIK